MGAKGLHLSSNPIFTLRLGNTSALTSIASASDGRQIAYTLNDLTAGSKTVILPQACHLWLTRELFTLLRNGSELKNSAGRWDRWCGEVWAMRNQRRSTIASKTILQI